MKLMDEQPYMWDALVNFFDIDDEAFPSDQLAFQQGTNRNIVLLNEGLNELMTYRRKNKLNVVNMGLKIFCKNKLKKDQDCLNEYRILQEGVDILMPYLKSNKRVLAVSKEMIWDLLEIHDHMLNFETIENKYGNDKFSQREMGSAIITYAHFAIAIWIGKNNVSLMISKEEINAIKFQWEMMEKQNALDKAVKNK